MAAPLRSRLYDGLLEGGRRGGHDGVTLNSSFIASARDGGRRLRSKINKRDLMCVIEFATCSHGRLFIFFFLRATEMNGRLRGRPTRRRRFIGCAITYSEQNSNYFFQNSITSIEMVTLRSLSGSSPTTFAESVICRAFFASYIVFQVGQGRTGYP